MSVTTRATLRSAESQPLTRHLYLLVENLGLSEPRRDLLFQDLERLGPWYMPQTSHINHWRPRRDRQAVLYEAEFIIHDVLPITFLNRVATLLSLPPQFVRTEQRVRRFEAIPTEFTTFTYGETPLLCTAIFGRAGTFWPTWPASRVEALAYLRANADAWEGFFAERPSSEVSSSEVSSSDVSSSDVSSSEVSRDR